MRRAGANNTHNNNQSGLGTERRQENGDDWFVDEFN